jgi:hypothetical protein
MAWGLLLAGSAFDQRRDARCAASINSISSRLHFMVVLNDEASLAGLSSQGGRAVPHDPPDQFDQRSDIVVADDTAAPLHASTCLAL